jgi:hypothetical protein
MPQSKRLSGCVNDVRDTSAGELMMQYLRVLFNSTTKRYETVLLEMLRKSFNMLILNVVRKGAIHRSIIDNIGPRVKDAKKIHNKSKTIGSSDTYDFKTSFPFKCQILSIKADPKRSSYPISIDVEGKDLNVHPLLKQVLGSVLICAKGCFFFSHLYHTC